LKIKIKTVAVDCQINKNENLKLFMSVTEIFHNFVGSYFVFYILRFFQISVDTYIKYLKILLCSVTFIDRFARRR